MSRAALADVTANLLREAAADVTLAVNQRDRAVRAALAEGMSTRQVGAIVGMSHAWVAKIAKG